MPAESYNRMSDQELADIVDCAASLAPVDEERLTNLFGPLSSWAVATGSVRLPVQEITDHDRGHERLPPPAADTVAFGEHLARACTFCHNPRLSGGPDGDVDIVEVEPGNLTPDPSGLAGWTFEDFERAMLEFRGNDGEELRALHFTAGADSKGLTGVELRALWTYLSTVPPVPYGQG